MSLRVTENEEIAEKLDEVADLLELQEANPFRVSAYRFASAELRNLDDPVAELYEDAGELGLQSITGVGRRLASAIAEILDTGRLRQLDDLRAQLSPIDVFVRLPGVGPKLARRIVDVLGAQSLEDLEQAAYEGRLEDVPGIGHRKAEGIENALVGIISRGARRRTRRRLEAARRSGEPTVEVLLELDQEYRRLAERDELPRIAPRRFNPSKERWLPIMEAERDGHDFTLVFSNTRRAHELRMTREWVVIYADNREEYQYTVITAYSGPLRGRRIVRGREAECRRYYEQRELRGSRPEA